MLRLFAVIAVAVMALAICMALGEVSITCNFPDAPVVPQAISAGLDDLSRPVTGLFGWHSRAVGVPASGDLQPQGNDLPDGRMQHRSNHHPHDRGFHLPG
jgi:hypothetical protein